MTGNDKNKGNDQDGTRYQATAGQVSSDRP